MRKRKRAPPLHGPFLILFDTTSTAPRRVYDIVSFLPPGDLEILRGDWVKEGTGGITKEVFLEYMLRVRSLQYIELIGAKLLLLPQRPQATVPRVLHDGIRLAYHTSIGNTRLDTFRGSS